MLSCGRKPILRMVLASRRLCSPDDGSDRASELLFSRFDMPRPKPPGYLFDLVRTKIFAGFELVAQSAPDDGSVGGAKRAATAKLTNTFKLRSAGFSLRDLPRVAPGAILWPARIRRRRRGHGTNLQLLASPAREHADAPTTP